MTMYRVEVGLLARRVHPASAASASRRVPAGRHARPGRLRRAATAVLHFLTRALTAAAPAGGFAPGASAWTPDEAAFPPERRAPASPAAGGRSQ